MWPFLLYISSTNFRLNYSWNNDSFVKFDLWTDIYTKQSWLAMKTDTVGVVFPNNYSSREILHGFEINTFLILGGPVFFPQFATKLFGCIMLSISTTTLWNRKLSNVRRKTHKTRRNASLCKTSTQRFNNTQRGIAETNLRCRPEFKLFHIVYPINQICAAHRKFNIQNASIDCLPLLFKGIQPQGRHVSATDMFFKSLSFCMHIHLYFIHPIPSIHVRKLDIFNKKYLIPWIHGLTVETKPLLVRKRSTNLQFRGNSNLCKHCIQSEICRKYTNTCCVVVKCDSNESLSLELHPSFCHEKKNFMWHKIPLACSKNKSILPFISNKNSLIF